MLVEYYSCFTYYKIPLGLLTADWPITCVIEIWCDTFEITS